MKIIKIAEYFSINRDDNELRVLSCPKCSSPNVKYCKAKVKLTTEDYYTPLIECIECKAYFTFYPEDGKREISKQEAEQGIKDGHIDRQPTGKDQHGHGYYIPFSEKPPCIPDSTYEKKMWNDKTPEEESEKFRNEMKRAISSSQIMDNIELLQCIDFKTIAKYKKDKKK